MPPHKAISAFSYLRAVQADDVIAVREFAGTEPPMPDLLVDAATRTVIPANKPDSTKCPFRAMPLGHRAPWLSGYRRRSPRYERDPHTHPGFLGLAAALCCCKRLLPLTT